MNRILRQFVKYYNALSNFIFYLPCGGETRFREKCLNFAGLDAGDRILDLCCGAGELTTVLADKRFTEGLIGVDISESAIEAANIKAQHLPVTFLKASADDLPFHSSRFDKCFISFGLHHISEMGRNKVLTEVNRVLEPEGILYIIDYNLPDKGLRRLAAITFAKLDESKEAYKMLKEGSLIREIGQAGFETVRRDLTCQDIVQLLAVAKK